MVELIRKTIQKYRRPYQTTILLEGMCNSNRLIVDDDRLELRFMDELFMIEKHIGEVQGIVGLQYGAEKEYIDENEVDFEVFEKAEQPSFTQKKVAGEEGGEEEPPAEEAPPEGGEDGEKKGPAFKVEDWKWTISDRRPKNLPQLFMQSKGIGARHEVRTAQVAAAQGTEGTSSHGGSGLTSNIDRHMKHEAVSRALDEFCQKLIDLRSGTEKYLYQQVIFNVVNYAE